MDIGAVTGIFSGVPYDWLVFGGLTLLIALDSLRSGIGRASSIALSLPVAGVLYELVSKTAYLGSIPVLTASPAAQAGTFAVVALASYLLVRRIALEYIESGVGEPVQALLAGCAATVVIIVVWLHVPVLEPIWQLSDKVHAIFSESYRLIWLLGAYLALAFARG